MRRHLLVLAVAGLFAAFAASDAKACHKKSCCPPPCPPPAPCVVVCPPPCPPPVCEPCPPPSCRPKHCFQFKMPKFNFCHKKSCPPPPCPVVYQAPVYAAPQAYASGQGQ